MLAGRSRTEEDALVEDLPEQRRPAEKLAQGTNQRSAPGKCWAQTRIRVFRCCNSGVDVKAKKVRSIHSLMITDNMSANFLTLPGELRNRVYELCLLHQEPIDPLYPYSQRREIAPGLLRSNKTVHREASSFFYAKNRFDFTGATSDRVATFLEKIGRNNADHIRHVHVSFPKFLHLEPGHVTLEKDSIGIFANIQSSCPNLSTITTSLYSTNEMEHELDAENNPQIVIEALALVNTLFRAISPLQEIIVEVYEDGPSDDIRKKMESHGWTVSETKCVKASDSEDDGYYGFLDDDGDYDDPDDYDIDNDSDFWRRAADD